MTQATNTHNSDSVLWAGAERGKGGVDGGTAAHEWRGHLAGNGVWDLVKEAGVPDGVGAEGALVEVVGAVEGSFWAEGLAAGEALFAVQAGVVLVAPADGVALLQGGDTLSELLLYVRIGWMAKFKWLSIPRQHQLPHVQDPGQQSGNAHQYRRHRSG